MKGILSFDWGVLWAIMAAVAIIGIFVRPWKDDVRQIARDLERPRQRYVEQDEDEIH